jgi:hypothetical protein
MRMRVHLACSAAIFVAASGGCGSGDRPKAFAGVTGHTVPPDAEFKFDAAAPPSCSIPQSSVCQCVDVPLLTDAPNMYFVLDRSGSMSADGKWDTVRQVVQSVAQSLGPRANYGVALFPHPTEEDCTPGIEVLPVSPGDSPAGSIGPTMKILLASLGAVVPGGGTPTAATLRALKSRLTALPGRTYVVLATDGAPNCNANAQCTASLCTANIEGVPGCDATTNCCTATTFGATACVDVDSVNAVAELEQANIPVYVIGVPGSAPYADLLDNMAKAGGKPRTQSPFYYRVDSTDSAALLDAMREVAANIVASCTLPVGAVADPNLINVYFDGQVVPRDAGGGWSINGTTITLNGVSCDKVMSGAVLDVRVIGGCPTIIK